MINEKHYEASKNGIEYERLANGLSVFIGKKHIICQAKYQSVIKLNRFHCECVCVASLGYAVNWKCYVCALNIIRWLCAIDVYLGAKKMYIIITHITTQRLKVHDWIRDFFGRVNTMVCGYRCQFTFHSNKNIMKQTKPHLLIWSLW